MASHYPLFLRRIPNICARGAQNESMRDLTLSSRNDGHAPKIDYISARQAQVQLHRVSHA